MPFETSIPDTAIASLPTAVRRAYALLCIESDPDVQARLARMLTLRGHRVVGTASCDGALALMAEWPVDLVLVAEPLRGAEDLSQVRRLHREHPRVPIAVMVSNLTEPMRIRALQAGASAVVPRPLGSEQLDALMHRLHPDRQRPFNLPIAENLVAEDAAAE